MNLIIHPRVRERHPQLTESDIKIAWHNSCYEALRPNSPNFPEHLWIGQDVKGRDIEMVGPQQKTVCSSITPTHPYPSASNAKSSQTEGDDSDVQLQARKRIHLDR